MRHALRTQQPTFYRLLGLAILGFYVGFLFFLEHEYHCLEPNKETFPDYRRWFIPAFVLLALLEFFVGLSQGVSLYSLEETIASVLHGSLRLFTTQCWNAWVGFSCYSFLWKRFALTHVLDEGPLGWWLAFFAVELAWYGLHRTGHTIHAFWVLHQAHHAPKFLTMLSSLYISMTHQLVTWMFFQPMALFFPPALMMAQADFNLVYQFWIHTELVPKLGPLEWFLNTPSQHRVHHGKNPLYIDKNYGGTLCIFDRLFGTFQEEVPEEVPISGLVHPYPSHNPILVNFLPWISLGQELRKASTWRERWGVLYYPPGWKRGTFDPPQFDPVPPVHTQEEEKIPTKRNRRNLFSVLSLFLSLILVTSVWLCLFPTWQGRNLLFGPLYLWFTWFTLGMRLDSSNHSLRILEYIPWFLAIGWGMVEYETS